MNDLVASPFGGGNALSGETAGARAQQSREIAELQTQYLMAERFPRNEAKAMDAIIEAFTRPTLAERSQYAYSKGGEDIAGASIHALQAIAQKWQNIEFGWDEVARGIGPDGVPYSEVRAVANDLQTRVRRRLQFIVRHWIDKRGGGRPIRDERELYELCANQAQRRVRSCLESVIPKDVVDVAIEQANKTMRTKVDLSPEGLQRLVEAFEPWGVTQEAIEKRAQRKLQAFQPQHVISLKRVYQSLRDGMSEASEWFELGAHADGGADDGAPAAASAVRAAAAAARSARTAEAPPPADPGATAAPPPADNPPPQTSPTTAPTPDQATTPRTSAQTPATGPIPPASGAVSAPDSQAPATTPAPTQEPAGTQAPPAGKSARKPLQGAQPRPQFEPGAFERVREKIEKARDRDAAELILDESRSKVPPEQLTQLAELILVKFHNA